MDQESEKKNSGEDATNGDQLPALHAALGSRAGCVRFLQTALVKWGFVEASAIEDPMGYDEEITARAIDAMANELDGEVAELCCEIGRGMAVWESLTANK